MAIIRVTHKAYAYSYDIEFDEKDEKTIGVIRESYRLYHEFDYNYDVQKLIDYFIDLIIFESNEIIARNLANNRHCFDIMEELSSVHGFFWACSYKWNPNLITVTYDGDKSLRYFMFDTTDNREEVL